MIRRGVALLLMLAAGPVAAREIDAGSLRRHIDVLASDAFGGRMPGTEGGDLTRDYIAQAWARAGLQPAGPRGWEQPVTILERRPLAQDARFFRRGRPVPVGSDHIVLIGQHEHDRVADARIVYAGTLDAGDSAIAPAIEGRVIVIAARPGKADDTEQELLARRAAYARAGAAAVLVVVDGDADWRRLALQGDRSSFALSGTAVPGTDAEPAIGGLVSESFMVALVIAGGGDWDKLRARSVQPGFAGADLGITAQLETATEIRAIDSANVVGRIPGRVPGSGAVLFMAHWDHLGTCRPPTAADRICNGAVDNASGIALITEVARELARRRRDRDIWFVATTAEETGLLGAKAFVAAPPLPLQSIVAAFNVDTVAIAPRGARVALIGRGMGPLDAGVESVARRLRRSIDTSTAANDFVTRQDGIVLMGAGVPTLMVNSSFSDRPALDRWLGTRYHGPADQDDGKLELGSAVQDANLHVALGDWFATIASYPAPAPPRP